MSQSHWPPEVPEHAPRQGMGMGVGAALGALVGLLGPIALGLLGWAVVAWASADAGGTLAFLVLAAVVSIPVVLLVGGCILMVPDTLRGWGVAALVASGVWLISSAGVCTVFFFGALASAETSMMVVPQ